MQNSVFKMLTEHHVLFLVFIVKYFFKLQIIKTICLKDNLHSRFLNLLWTEAE